MKTEDAPGNNSSHGQEVKSIRKMLPNIGIPIFAKTFVIESIDLSDLPTLMVSPQYGDATLVSDFECHQESDCFQTVVPSIHIITHEEIIGFRTFSTNTK
jgi:hypothetical protein